MIKELKILVIIIVLSYFAVLFIATKDHHIIPTHVTIDERGYYSVTFYYKGSEYGLDYLTKAEYDSLQNGTLSCLNK